MDRVGSRNYPASVSSGLITPPLSESASPPVGENESLVRAIVRYMTQSEECSDGFATFMLNEVLPGDLSELPGRIGQALGTADVKTLAGPELLEIARNYGVNMAQGTETGGNAPPYDVKKYLGLASSREMQPRLIKKYLEDFEMRKFDAADGASEGESGASVDGLGTGAAESEVMDGNGTVSESAESEAAESDSTESSSASNFSDHSSREESSSETPESEEEESSNSEETSMEEGPLEQEPEPHSEELGQVITEETPEETTDNKLASGNAIPKTDAIKPVPSSRPVTPQMGPDWTVDSKYLGTIQPPLALRLEQVLNFLREEDVDRCLNWRAKFDEVNEYLRWLASGDPDKQLQRASTETRAMFRDALSKLLIHRNFENHHYKPTPLEIEPLVDQPLKSTRLNRYFEGLDAPQPIGLGDELGVSRAGMQQAIERLRLPDHAGALGPSQHVVLPKDAETLRRAREEVEGPHWAPIRLEEDQMLLQLETKPYTLFWREYMRRLDKAHGDAASKIVHPSNLALAGPAGPVVWRGVSQDAAASQHLLDRCRTVDKLLQQAADRWPRPLLERITESVAQGKQGMFEGSKPARRLQYRSDPPLVEARELSWMDFLATACRNKAAPADLRHVNPDHKLYRIFATRVLKLLGDKSPDAQFKTHNTKVTVPQLVAAMNKGCDGPVKKTTFEAKDACYYLDRMASDKFIRFKKSPRLWGIVQRPDYDVLPEQFVKWPASKPATVADKDVSEGSELWNSLSAMAARIGHTLYVLERENPKFQMRKRITAGDAESAEQRAAQRKDDVPPQKPLREAVVRVANPADFRPDMSDDAALALIRTRIADELCENLPMLGPGRLHYYQPPTSAADKDADTAATQQQQRPEPVRKHDLDWSWASAAVRGPRPQYWRLDRWPVGAGWLSSEAEARVRNDSDVDAAQLFDAKAADPIPAAYRNRTLLRPYGADADRGVRFLPGKPIYPVGDTRRQARRVEEYVTARAAAAFGIDPNTHRARKRAKRSLFARLFSGMRRKRVYEPVSTAWEGRPDDGGAWLPAVDPAMVPKSWYPRRQAQKREGDVDMEDVS